MDCQKIGQAAEVVALIMVLASIVALVIESDAAMAEEYQAVFATSRTVFAVFFISEYFQLLKDHDTRANAYWSVEHDHMSIFGRTRYNGHEVFATVLSRWNTKRRFRR